ncbi:ABC transporter [Pollutimonas nitritireducens]|uniref:ABC transporter n=1 Tax=Pollutimonas nitritireducens TaxID=2045209 RepID=A0A2N4UIM1_9BURK|nr:ABC transporter substrate-binding protein [Pollutimonas nitritireducens]PLC54858.1 ABC transporter [Pollutimonas nitritireducens]
MNQHISSASREHTSRGGTSQRNASVIFFIATLFILALLNNVHAQRVVNPLAEPNAFIEAVGNNALDAVRQDPAAKRGDTRRINELIDQYLLPYVNFEKTTRLAAAQGWRTASSQQRKQLVEAFRGTLIRTYAGALTDVDKIAALNLLPFRGDPKAKDVVVRSYFSQRNGPQVNVDYRMESTPEGWKIYDINVEGIWLIQNYRNQFAQQIRENGVDGLINALNQKNQ